MQEEQRRVLEVLHPFAERWEAVHRRGAESAAARQAAAPSSRLTPRFQLLSRTASIATILLGFSVLLGWISNSGPLKSLMASLPATRANAAVCFVLAGAALWLLQIEDREQAERRVARAFAFVVALVGLLTLAEHLSGLDFGLDLILFRTQAVVAGAASPGRMGIHSALNFFLVGCALLFLDVETRRGYWPAQFLSLVAASTSLVAVNGYIYHIETVPGLASYWALPFYGALGFVVLSMGIFFARPNAGLMAIVTSDTAGGFLARRLAIAIIGVPLVLGWIRLAGQRTGVYSSEFGVSLFVVLGMLVLAAFVWRSAVVLDRTDAERRHAEAELLQREKRFQALIDSSSDAIALIDANGTILYASPSTHRILGHSAAEFAGRDAFDAVHPDDLQGVLSLFAELLQKPGATLASQYRYRHKDGTWRWLEGSGTNLLAEPAVQAIVCNYRDITVRKQAQDAVAHFAAIVESSDDAIIGEDLQGDIISWNAAAERMYGYKAEEVIGRPISLLVPLEHPEEIPQIMERLRRGESVNHFDTARVKKNGELVEVSLTISPVKDAAGNIVGASTIARDISESKRSEDALQQANAVLTGWLRELEKRSLETSLLNEMGDLLQTCVSVEEAYAVVARFGQQLFPSESGALCVMNASRNLVEAVAVWGASLAGERVFAPDECWALRRGQPHLTDDSASGLICRHVQPRPGRSYLCVPMMGQGEALGVLHLQSGNLDDEPDSRLTETKQRLAITSSGHVGLALANLRLRETLRIQSIRDPLTGLYNRRYMEESLARELRRAARNQRTCGAIMLDLDLFKRFNDTFGHEAGDALLRELGTFLQHRTRREDIACRYGGEEFVIILPEASVEVTCHRADRLRDEFKRLSVQHRGRALGSVTLSLGVAVFPDHGSTVEEILRAADRALYRAKGEGRDRAVVGEPAE